MCANMVTMWFSLLLLAGTGSVFCYGKDSPDDINFDEWTLMYNKEYSSANEKAYRETVFLQNKNVVKVLNEQYKKREVTFQLNHFADMTAFEFKNQVLMKSIPPPIFPNEVYHSSGIFSTDLPSTFDWRDQNVVTSVKNQGSVGSCWAFSTVGNIEGQWALSGHPLISLSVELLVDCDATMDTNNGSMNADCGVFGGWPYLAYQYLIKLGGIELDVNYPYCSGFGKCFPCQAPAYNRTRCGPPVPKTSCLKNDSCLAKLNSSRFVDGLKVKSWVAVPQNESVIKEELVQRGPLSIAINALLLQFYHSGVWDPILSCDPKTLDHAVLLVGYGTHQGMFGSKPYWLVKNSWGEKWGQKGYFMMVRGKGKCGIDQQVTSAVLEHKKLV